MSDLIELNQDLKRLDLVVELNKAAHFLLCKVSFFFFKVAACTGPYKKKIFYSFDKSRIRHKLKWFRHYRIRKNVLFLQQNRRAATEYNSNMAFLQTHSRWQN